jgi:hypothetical protein
VGGGAGSPIGYPANRVCFFEPHGSLNWRYCRAFQKLDVTAGLKRTQYTDPLYLEFVQAFRIGRRVSDE